MGNVEPECLNEEAVLRVARAEDGRLATAGHGELACFEIKTGVATGVLAVVALKALAFDDGPDVAGEIEFLGDAGRVEAILRIVVRTGLTGGAVGQEYGSKEGQGGENNGPSVHTEIMPCHAVEATHGLSNHVHILSGVAKPTSIPLYHPRLPTPFEARKSKANLG